MFSREIKKKKEKKLPPLDWIGFCLLKMSDNLDFVGIEKFKNSSSVSNDQCLKYIRKQCVSYEDIILTVHIGYHIVCENCKKAYYNSHFAPIYNC